MHTGRDQQDRPLISSEVPGCRDGELSSKVLIHGASLEAHEPGNGHSPGAHQACCCQTQQLGGKCLLVSPSSEPAPSLGPVQVDSLDEHNGLGKPSLLGEDIIPLSGLVAPHLQRHLQAPAQPTPIKAASPGPSRAPPVGGEHVSQELPRDETPSTMIFSDLYKAPRTTLTKFRNSFPHGVQPPPDLDADLVSRDKARNKEAVKKYLAEKVRTDWDFTWPSVVASPPSSAEQPATPAQQEDAQATEDDPQDTSALSATADEDAPRDPGEEADSESDAESVYSTISEDPGRFRPRDEWTSDLSDTDEPHSATSPFRFDSPDAIGAAVSNSLETKRTRRRRAVRDEVKWNPGLACFEARRDAWTGAKTVRVKPKPPSPVFPTHTRRLSFWRHNRTQSSASHTAVVTSSSPPALASPIQPPETRTSTTTASESDSGGVHRTTSQDSTAPHVLYPVHTVIPVPPPLLPPQNPMRASIQPSMYGSLYDKVVVQSLQPSCPVNLADMLRACVVGWKRDGEWPPKSIYPAPAPAQTANAEVLAMRQRKAQQQRSKNAAANAAATTGRRLSLVGFFNGGGGTVTTTKTVAPAQERRDSKDNKEGKDSGLGHSQSHSDEGAGSSGKALFRRSLQKVFSFGQHGHAHDAVGGNGSPNGPLSPTSPSTKEVTAAG